MTFSLQATQASVDRIEVVAAETPFEIGAVLELRRQVFKVEQGMGGEAVEDADDRRSVLALALLRDAEGRGRPVGTGRLTHGAGPVGEAVVTWVATAADLRGRGIGEAVMRFLLDAADRGGATAVLLAAQATAVLLAAQAPAVRFYRRLGFVSNGRPYVSSGIGHLPMIRRPPTDRQRAPGWGGMRLDW